MWYADILLSIWERCCCEIWTPVHLINRLLPVFDTVRFNYITVLWGILIQFNLVTKFLLYNSWESGIDTEWITLMK